jgi:hypothetical protein
VAVKDLYGPNGLVVNSNVPLASGATHGATSTADSSEFAVGHRAHQPDLAVFYRRPRPGSPISLIRLACSRATTSFGPILSERARIIGAAGLGFAYQRPSPDRSKG